MPRKFIIFTASTLRSTFRLLYHAGHYHYHCLHHLHRSAKPPSPTSRGTTHNILYAMNGMTSPSRDSEAEEEQLSTNSLSPSRYIEHMLHFTSVFETVPENIGWHTIMETRAEYRIIGCYFPVGFDDREKESREFVRMSKAPSVCTVPKSK